jgi:glycosyltransferase involved in cell wall biosynthesis
LISIVTPSLNRAAYIAEAIESVLHQDRADFEHIIVDGGSQDATAEILQRYPHLRVINEPDRGLYDAINKGIGLAKGEVIGFLNTDDCYEANVFGTIAQLFEENPNADALVGGSTIFRETQSGERQALACFSARPERDLLTQVSTGLPPFNGWFFRKELFQRIGYFNIRYQYSADRDLLIRMALMGVKYLCVDQHVYRYRQHPDSLTFSGSGSAESQFFLENTTLAEDYLTKTDLPPHARRKILFWHSQLVTDRVLFALSQRNFRKAITCALRGLRFDQAWFLVFMKNVPISVRRIGSRNLDRLRIKSQPPPRHNES